MASNEKRRYRDTPGNIFAGLFALSIAIYCAYQPVVSLVTGVPMMLSNGRTPNAGHHLSNTGDLWMLIGGWSLFGFLGLYLLLSWLNAYIEVDNRELSAKNALGLTIFQATWEAIDRVELKTSNFSRVDKYVIYSGNHKVSLKSTFPNADELLQTLRKRCPNIDPRGWR